SGNGGAYTPTFIDKSTYLTSSYTTFAWIFGDGASAGFGTSSTTTHLYQAVSAPTTYTTWEIVSTPFGVSSTSQTVSVSESGPSALFSATSTSGNGPVQFQFNDGSSYPTPSNTTTWAWNFGDGIGTSSLESPSYTYGAVVAPTEYTIQLIVTTDFGTSTSTQVNYISVNEPAPISNYSVTPSS